MSPNFCSLADEESSEERFYANQLHELFHMNSSLEEKKDSVESLTSTTSSSKIAAVYSFGGRITVSY